MFHLKFNKYFSVIKKKYKYLYERNNYLIISYSQDIFYAIIEQKKKKKQFRILFDTNSIKCFMSDQ